MRTEKTFLKNLAWGAPLFAGALLFVQCSSDSGNADTMNTGGEVRELPDGQAVTGSDLDAEVKATYDNQAANNSSTAAVPGSTTSAGGTTTTVVVLTPAKERMMATNDMRGLRSLLMADLEAVRARLNDGARTTPERDADKALAADLAQGLERVDRALVALGASSDATWASIRDVQLKEVAEVRAWMADYRAKDSWAMK